MEIITLKNKIRIVLEYIPYLRSVSLGFWIKNGSRNETAAQSGISHFTEHMLFKGTKNRSAKDIADQIDRIGGQINAFTTKEFTCYYTRTLDKDLPKGFDILSDMLLNSLFDQEEIDKERNVILEEINMYEDNPEDVASDLMQYSVWEGHSLGYPVLGTRDTISKFTTHTFKDYLAANYNPEKIVISIAGNFDESQVMDLVNSLNEYTNPPLRGERTLAKYQKSIALKTKDIEQVHLQLGFESINYKSDYIYTMAALNAILGGSMSSYLFQSIREERGLAYSVYSYQNSYEDTGLFSICVGLVKENVEPVIDLVQKEITQLKAGKITKEQLEKTKAQLTGNYILSLESSGSRMNSIGRTLITLDRVLTPDQIIEKIDEINLDKIYDLSNLLDLSQMSISAVGDLDGLDFNQWT